MLAASAFELFASGKRSATISDKNQVLRSVSSIQFSIKLPSS
jgi:hypothetical protein